jgi:hypothetical protein
MLPRQKKLSECNCGDIGKVLMLSDREHLFFG